LKIGLCVTWSVSLLLAIATIFGVQRQRYAIKTVGQDTAPSIILAQQIKESLAAMDASAVNELLVKSKENPSAIKDYEESRKAFAGRIIDAARNITYGDAERKPIETLQLVLGDYIAKIQQARDLNARGDSQGVLNAYREAAQLMDNTLLPATDALDQINSKELDLTYDRQKVTTASALFLIVISGLLLLGVLVATQLFLHYRMRRVFNPMLMAATGITVIFVGYTTESFISSSDNLKIAKEDSFLSLHALGQASALAYSLKADESRYLLDPVFARKHDQAFLDKAAKIAKIPQSQTFETVAAASAPGKNVDGFTGLLADELNNITFPGEREAATATLVTFGRYFLVNKQIRELEQSGKHQEAIALCTNQSNSAFLEFNTAHQKTYDINREAFNKAVEGGFNNVNGFEATTPVVAVVVSVLTLLGLLPRIKEYE
jgi:preprotein translocase subunit SecE